MSAPLPDAFDPQTAWRQVLDRDPRADGRFVYAVETTGVFCRPSCPSRRPALRHVRFFRSADDALAAGYRCCRRCHPAGVYAESKTVSALCDHIEANLDRMITLRELGERAGLSPFTVQRMFERVLGVSPRHYQIERRSARLREQLGPRTPITQALYRAGFPSASRLYEHAAATLGMRPRAYREFGAGERIVFATAPCPLGWVLVAATGRGVCRVALDDSPEALESALRARFHQAEILPCHPHSAPEFRSSSGNDPAQSGFDLAQALQAVLSAMTEHPAALDLPLDLRATAFEQRVWQALRAIPRGQTRSYSELAAQLGRPRAARAVAQACARNPVALLIPCHRVIGKSGALTGYRWGAERKRRLLALEGRRLEAGPAGEP